MIEANLARERKILVYLQSTPVTQERKDQLVRLRLRLSPPGPSSPR